MTIHPHDKSDMSNLRLAVQKLIDSKVKSGIDPAGMADRNGHREHFMRVPWDQDRRTENWQWSTLYGLVDGAGGSITCNLWNLERKPEAVLFHMAATSPIYGGVGLLELFQIVRRDRGISNAKFGEMLGIVKSAVNKIDQANDPRLGTLYRHARILGGRLLLGVSAGE